MCPGVSPFTRFRRVTLLLDFLETRDEDFPMPDEAEDFFRSDLVAEDVAERGDDCELEVKSNPMLTVFVGWRRCLLVRVFFLFFFFPEDELDRFLDRVLLFSSSLSQGSSSSSSSSSSPSVSLFSAILSASSLSSSSYSSSDQSPYPYLLANSIRPSASAASSGDGRSPGYAPKMFRPIRLFALAARRRLIMPPSLSLTRGPDDVRFDPYVCLAASDIDEEARDVEEDFKPDDARFFLLVDFFLRRGSLPIEKPTPRVTVGPFDPTETPTFVSNMDCSSSKSSSSAVSACTIHSESLSTSISSSRLTSLIKSLLGRLPVDLEYFFDDCFAYDPKRWRFMKDSLRRRYRA
mmetsp:Transcript_3427/g.8133  ORF Transcript_3427/g.8133 Transcript_3427/m.8133 type:complete len:349 (-) Transcript_3427:3948-4994(-)